MKPEFKNLKWEARKTSIPTRTSIWCNGDVMHEFVIIHNETTSRQSEANVKLIENAPELLYMVESLAKSIQRLTGDDVSQFDRDNEAEWIGNAYELINKITK
jgi:hypothetical protein